MRGTQGHCAQLSAGRAGGGAKPHRLGPCTVTSPQGALQASLLDAAGLAEQRAGSLWPLCAVPAGGCQERKKMCDTWRHWLGTGQRALVADAERIPEVLANERGRRVMTLVWWWLWG